MRWKGRRGRGALQPSLLDRAATQYDVLSSVNMYLEPKCPVAYTSETTNLSLQELNLSRCLQNSL